MNESQEPPVTASELPFGVPVYSIPSLTKREWFAVLAMQGLSANSGTRAADIASLRLLPGLVAEMSVSLADALIAELNKSNP